jgi:hypothetical protein
MPGARSLCACAALALAHAHTAWYEPNVLQETQDPLQNDVNLKEEGRAMSNVGAGDFQTVSHNGHWMLMAGFTGNDLNDWEGQSISLSGNGKNLAIGAPRNHDACPERSSPPFCANGRVRVFRKENENATHWFQLGSTLMGLQEGEQMGYSVGISANGEVVIIGSPYESTVAENAGVVRVYHLLQGNWTIRGQIFYGDGNGDRCGVTVSISDDGKTIAFGAPNAAEDGNNNAGVVRVYEYVEGEDLWVQKGEDIEGSGKNDMDGSGITLGRYGGVIAVSSTQQNAVNHTGSVRIFKWDNVTKGWRRKGEPLRGKFHNDAFGRSVAIDLLANTVVVGAPKNSENGTNAGMTRVFYWDAANEKWSKLGHDLAGGGAHHQSGHSVALSDDGRTVAIGAPFHDSNNRTQAGTVRIHQFEDNNWHRTVTISGQGNYHTAGYSVALSGSGHSVAIGEVMVKHSEHVKLLMENSQDRFSKKAAPSPMQGETGSSGLPGQVLIYGIAKPCFYDDLLHYDTTVSNGAKKNKKAAKIAGHSAGHDGNSHDGY